MTVLGRFGALVELAISVVANRRFHAPRQQVQQQVGLACAIKLVPRLVVVTATVRMLRSPQRLVLPRQFLWRIDDSEPKFRQRLVEIVDDKVFGQIVGGGGEGDGRGTGKRFNQCSDAFRKVAQNRGGEIPLAALVRKWLWHFH